MDHNGFERQIQHFLATIKINCTNPPWCIAWRDCADFSLVLRPISRVLESETKLVYVMN